MYTSYYIILNKRIYKTKLRIILLTKESYFETGLTTIFHFTGATLAKSCTSIKLYITIYTSHTWSQGDIERVAVIPGLPKHTVG